MGNDRSKLLIGLVIIAAGVILLLKNLGVTDISILPYWPILLIVWGANAFFSGSRNPGALGMSFFVIVLGFLILARNLEWMQVDFGRIFSLIVPVVIILLGLSLFSGRSFTGKTNTAFLGGMERGKSEPWELESGSYFAFMGGIELDLRHAIIPEGETVLDLTAFMGGIEVRVPGNISVEADGFAVLGGVDFFGKGSGGVVGSTRNSLKAEGAENRLLKIQSRAVMGGIDVKRV